MLMDFLRFLHLIVNCPMETWQYDRDVLVGTFMYENVLIRKSFGICHLLVNDVCLWWFLQKDLSHSCSGGGRFWTKFKRIIAFLYSSLPINLVFFHCRFTWRIFTTTTFRWGMVVILTFKPKVRIIYWKWWSSLCIIINYLWIIFMCDFVVRTPNSIFSIMVSYLLLSPNSCGNMRESRFCGSIMASLRSFDWSIMATMMRWCILVLAFWRSGWLILEICLRIVHLFYFFS